MAKAKKKKITITVPYGTTVYPSLHKLDTEGQFPTNKYKTDILLSPENLAKFKADFKEKTKGMGLDKSSKLPFKVDKEGQTLVRLKSNFMPSGFDSANHKFPTFKVRNPVSKAKDGMEERCMVEVGGGSTIRCLAEVFEYDGGVSLQITQYQVKELKTWDRDAPAFDKDDDGYTHDAEATKGFDGDAEEDADTSDDLDI